jgi:AraC-like DNA-binding protein/mannose-6-phosphate isomerase-like protein (cupin superfamily)
MDIISKRKHAVLWKTAGVARTNGMLMSSFLNAREFKVGDLHLRCSQCHLATGLYRKGAGFGSHKHADIQIEIPLLGSFQFEFEKTKTTLKPSQALVIPALLPHSWRSPTGGFMLGIHVSVTNEQGEETPLPFCVQKKPLVARSEAISLLSRQLIDIAVSARNLGFAQTHTSALLTALVTGVLDPVCDFPQGMNTEENLQLRGRVVFERVQSFIQNNLTHELGAEELESLAGVTFRHLTRLFLQHCGETPHQHILRLRLEHSKRLLVENPGRSIKSIASESGFSASSHLTMAFKKEFQITPTAFALGVGK